MSICIHCLHFISIFGLEDLRLRSVLASRLLPALPLIALRFRLCWIWFSSIVSSQSASLSHSFDLNPTTQIHSEPRLLLRDRHQIHSRLKVPIFSFFLLSSSKRARSAQLQPSRAKLSTSSGTLERLLSPNFSYLATDPSTAFCRFTFGSPYFAGAMIRTSGHTCADGNFVPRVWTMSASH